MQFVIYDEGGAVNVTNSNNEIVFSNAAGPSNDTYIVNGETNACIQGGDNESEFFSSYFEGMRTQPQIHLTWGKFNYRQRKPGERMLPSGDEVPSPYGFPVEFRIR